MKISAKISAIIGSAAISAMLVVPTMADTTNHASFQAGKFTGIGTGDIPLMARGGDGNGEREGSGSASSNRDDSGSGDQDRDRDGSCLDNITATTSATGHLLAGNGNGSGDQDQSQDQERDGSCQV